MDDIQLTRDIRREFAKELWRSFQLHASKIVVTFDTQAITVAMFPPREGKYKVTAGPHTLVVRDNIVEES